MKFLFDQNISHRVIEKLSDHFKESTSVKKEGLFNATDLAVWEFARKSDLVIVTQDSDFNDLTILYSAPPKIIWIRSGNLNTDEIVDLFNNNETAIQTFLNDQELGCFEIIKMR